MADKFTDEDIKEIVSKLKWQPNKYTYILIISILIMIVAILCLVIYLILNQKAIKCDLFNFQEQTNKKINDIIKQQISSFDNKIQESLLNHSNEIRYLISTSGRHMPNKSLLDKEDHTPIFSNEKENPLLYLASSGN